MPPVGKDPLVGLDITTSSVKLIELVEERSRVSGRILRGRADPPNAINEKAIVDAEAVGEAIRRAIKRAGTDARSCDRDLRRRGDHQSHPDAEELERDAISKARSSCKRTNTFRSRWKKSATTSKSSATARRDPEMVDVLLVATRTENVEQRQVAVEAAGLTAKIVDVEAFAVENACQLLTHQMPDAGTDHTIAIVDFGASTTTFSVLKDLKVIYTRDFAFGGQQLTEEIMRTYGLSMEDAGRAKKEGGLPSNYQPEVLDAFIDDMSQQVSRSLQFFLASGSGREQPDQILICGGCANIPGVADVIGSRVGIAAQIGDPLGQMKISWPRQVARRGS